MDQLSPATAAGPRSWTCPECKRHIPGYIDVCRCGAERRRLEELGFELAPVSPIVHEAFDPRASMAENRLAQRLIGYRSDEALSPAWRVTVKGVCLAVTIAVAVMMVRFVQRDPLPRRDNIRVVSTLDDFTQNAGPTAANTMPAFLALPGAVGALRASSNPEEPVLALDEAELRSGFCTQSVARQIRHQYPGYYDSWPDDKLEHVALEKYPELRDRLCTLSYKIEATPEDIIKYELQPRTVIASAGLWLTAVFITAIVALGCANLYYRGLVNRVAA